MEQKKVYIRPAEPEDFEAVRVLENLDCSVHAQARPDYFRDGQADYSREEFETLLSRPCPIALVAEENGAVVGLCFGFVTEHPGDSFCKPRRFALIQDLVTAPACRGKGIATALLGHARLMAAQAGAVSMELCVWAFNETARALYEKAGMRVQYYRMEMDLTKEDG